MYKTYRQARRFRRISSFYLVVGVLVILFSYRTIFGAAPQAGTSNGGLTTRVAPGELLPISIKLTNFGGQSRADVTITYRILDQAGMEKISTSETVAVETTASFIKIIQIPTDFQPGNYTAESSILYKGQKVPGISSFQFVVERKILGIFMGQLIVYAIIALTVGIIFVFVSRMFMQKARVGRFDPHQYLDIPTADRLYYEIISDIIMQMRYRIGDQALEIATGIEGLSVDKENGKVLRIKKEPSKIIALLVSNYEKLLKQRISFAFENPRHPTTGQQTLAEQNLVVLRNHKN